MLFAATATAAATGFSQLIRSKDCFFPSTAACVLFSLAPAERVARLDNYRLSGRKFGFSGRWLISQNV